MKSSNCPFSRGGQFHGGSWPRVEGPIWGIGCRARRVPGKPDLIRRTAGACGARPDETRFVGSGVQHHPAWLGRRRGRLDIADHGDRRGVGAGARASRPTAAPAAGLRARIRHQADVVEVAAFIGDTVTDPFVGLVGNDADRGACRRSAPWYSKACERGWPALPTPRPAALLPTRAQRGCCPTGCRWRSALLLLTTVPTLRAWSNCDLP